MDSETLKVTIFDCETGNIEICEMTTEQEQQHLEAIKTMSVFPTSE
jgi:hypothetical protein